MQSQRKVCITGASGYIGAWITKLFLEDGHYSVRGTVRDPNNSQKVDELKAALGSCADDLELVAADLVDAESLKRAFEGMDYVIHVASPLLLKEPKDEEEVLGPAIKGTENAINACYYNNVKRIVVTSSSLSITNYHLDQPEVDEDTWAEIHKDTNLYTKSKILAEKKAWEMIKKQPAGKSLELVTVLPSLVTGRPLLKGDFTSGYLGTALMTGKLPKCPHVFVPVVDVEDVAKGHLLAVTAPAGERYCLIEDTYRFVDIGIAFSKEFKQYGYKCADTELSYCLAKILSCCVSDVRYFIKIWGKRRHIRNDKSKKMLGMKNYKSLDQSVKEMGWGLIELDMVPDKTKDKK